MQPKPEHETSVLTSAWAKAVEESIGGRWPRRTKIRTVIRFRDWLIDGRPLRDWIAYGDPRDNERPLMYESNQYDAGVAASLEALLSRDVGPEEESVRFPDGRTAILFCGACGDIWCGAISARVEVGKHFVVWSDIAFQDRVTNEISTDRPALTLRL